MVKYKTLRRKRSLSKFKVGMVSLGCDKNRVDSELILGSINKFYEITNNPKEAEIIIINTCGFIESAKQESIDTILEMAEYKKTHKCKMIIATGCLTQRYGDELLELIPEIDILMLSLIHIYLRKFTRGDYWNIVVQNRILLQSYKNCSFIVSKIIC